MCCAKCTDLTVGHQTHHTNVHRMTAFRGCRSHGTKDFVFEICTSRQVHSDKWAQGDEKPLPFNKFMEKHYPDWTIPIIKDAQIAIKNEIRWVKVRQRLCDYYGLEDNTPQDWLTLVYGHCPICMNTFGTEQCGKDVKTPCGHSICYPCLAQLRGRPEVERKCPQCREKLPPA
ncbi:hypothetical protein BC937DRAFT_89486 [Endogone sp. FLAS-F59071]|nr:hypothetical protein BC937DRAFT_89486 [Endogone sp. FLAS-F59071]|eukprot:RUS17794.1 hypothetical protein BC937DRAFT_89486 [Endogone sp. FLAS-F59071]